MLAYAAGKNAPKGCAISQYKHKFGLTVTHRGGYQTFVRGSLIYGNHAVYISFLFLSGSF
jgi:hypothetical protein